MTDKLQEMKKMADEKLEAVKDEVNSRRNEKKLQAEIDKARELVKKDFSGFDPYFSFGILTQLSSLKCGKCVDVDDAMKLRFERSNSQRAGTGRETEIEIDVGYPDLISVHQAMMNFARSFSHIQKPTRMLKRYGNMFGSNLRARLQAQTEALQRLPVRPRANAAWQRIFP